MSPAEINATHPNGLLRVNAKPLSFGKEGVWVGGGQTYILHPSMKEDDLTGPAAAIAVLVGANRNNMLLLEKE